ncbi:BTAD domain-containing putative transcriptional regulator [Nocardioides humilatus]|nr:BTAD domain-containing putative transcriptional regulator [Nocardioides humilatus]
MMVRIEVLGGFSVSVAERAVDPAVWRRRKPAGLVKLLALAPGHRLHREQLIDVLWPDLGAAAGAANLRKAVHEVRRALEQVGGADVLGSDANLVWLAGGDVQVDLDDFHRAVATARRDRDVDSYTRAIDLYRTGLLPEDRYEDWASAEHDSVHLHYLAALEELAGLLVAGGAIDAAIDVVRRLVDADPLREDNHATLIRLNALAGRRADALHAYERLRATLAEELGAEPGPETEKLVEELRSRQGIEPELAAGMWERVGDLRMLSGDGAGAAKAFGTAITSGGDEDAGRLHRKTADAWLLIHRPAEAATCLAAADAATPDPDPAERSRLLRSHAHHGWESGDFVAARDFAERAFDTATVDGTSEDVAAALEATAIVAHFTGAWREGMTSELERMAVKDDGPGQLARVYEIHHCIGQFHLYGDALLPSVEGYARGVIDRAEESAAVRAQAFGWCLLGESLLLQARWDEAVGCLERSVDLNLSLDSRSGALPLQRLAEVAVCRGAPEEAEAYLRKASAIATVSSMGMHLWGRIYATKTFAALEQGDAHRAIDAVRGAAAAAVRNADCPPCNALVHPMAAEAYALVGDVEGARTHAAAAHQTGQMFASSAWQAMAESAAGSVALAEDDQEEARLRFEAARDLYGRAGMPYWADRASRSLALTPVG